MFCIEEYHFRSTFFIDIGHPMLVAMFNKKYRRNNKKSVRNLVLGDCFDSKTQIIRRHFSTEAEHYDKGLKWFLKKTFLFFLQHLHYMIENLFRKKFHPIVWCYRPATNYITLFILKLYPKRKPLVGVSMYYSFNVMIAAGIIRI